MFSLCFYFEYQMIQQERERERESERESEGVRMKKCRQVILKQSDGARRRRANEKG